MNYSRTFVNILYFDETKVKLLGRKMFYYIICKTTGIEKKNIINSGCAVMLLGYFDVSGSGPFAVTDGTKAPPAKSLQTYRRLAKLLEF